MGRAGQGSGQDFLHTLSALELTARVGNLGQFPAQHFSPLSCSCSGASRFWGSSPKSWWEVIPAPPKLFQPQLSPQCSPESCWRSGSWLWGSQLDKLLRAGILSVQGTDPTRDQPEVFSAGEVPNLLPSLHSGQCLLSLVSPFSSSRLWLINSVCLSSHRTPPAPAADQKLLPTMGRVCVSHHFIKSVSHPLPKLVAFISKCKHNFLSMGKKNQPNFPSKNI